MAVFHNLLLRSLNTIYLQAPSVKDSDKKAFIGYAYCWYDAIDAHHTGEEKEFFPWIEEAAGEQGIMDANIEQHSEYDLLLNRCWLSIPSLTVLYSLSSFVDAKTDSDVDRDLPRRH